MQSLSRKDVTKSSKESTAVLDNVPKEKAKRKMS